MPLTESDEAFVRETGVGHGENVEGLVVGENALDARLGSHGAFASAEPLRELVPSRVRAVHHDRGVAQFPEIRGNSLEIDSRAAAHLHQNHDRSEHEGLAVFHRAEIPVEGLGGHAPHFAFANVQGEVLRPLREAAVRVDRGVPLSEVSATFIATTYRDRDRTRRSIAPIASGTPLRRRSRIRWKSFSAPIRPGARRRTPRISPLKTKLSSSRSKGMLFSTAIPSFRKALRAWTTQDVDAPGKRKPRPPIWG